MAKTKKSSKQSSPDEPVNAVETSDEAPVDVESPSPAIPQAQSTPAFWLTWLSGKVNSDRLATFIVLGLGILVFIPFLGSLTLWDPWETHYGEVARAMIARQDYVYPYWESAYFFSKPAMTLWMIAGGLWLFRAEHQPPGEPLGEWVEWGVRLPFAVLAIAMLYAVYRIAKHIQGREAGLITAFVLASSAQFIFIGKQAMSDMPFVGFMTVGLWLFCEAVFDEDATRPANRTEKILASLGIAIPLGFQLIIIGVKVQQTAAFVAIAAAAALGLLFIFGIISRGSRRDALLAGFYVCAALSALGKGLAVLVVLGPTVILYMLFTLDWRILLRSKVYLGWVLFLLVGSPWYITLSLFGGRNPEGKTFVERFWIHDNLNRVGAGVHGDRGGVGYYFEQLAYGMFPWIALFPFGIAHAVTAQERKMKPLRQRELLFVLIWALWVYAFFTGSQTKFHHYIFPAVPAFAILVGTWLAWVAQDPEGRLKGWIYIPIVVVAGVVLRDIINDPQNMVSLFTYKYDREYPRELTPRNFLIPFAVIFGVAVAGMWLVKSKAHGLLAFILCGGLFGAWISHKHFNYLAPHWGQGHIFKTLYKERKGNEPIYAYQLNWRGETFYSRNTVVQVKESGANARMRKLVDAPGREFILVEQSRYHTLRNLLSADKRDKLHILDRSSNKFYLCIVDE